MLDPAILPPPADAIPATLANQVLSRLNRIAAAALRAKGSIAISHDGGSALAIGSSRSDPALSPEAIAAILATRRPILIEDADELPEGEARALARALGVRALVGVPFSQSASRHGVLLVCDDVPRDWGGNAFALLQDLADGAVARWELLEEVGARKRREEELRLLQSLTEAIFSAQDVASAIHVTLKQVCEFTSWEYGEAWLPDDADERLESAPAWFAVREDPFTCVSRTLTFTRGTGLPGQVWATRRSIWERDLTNSPSYPRLNLAASVGITAAVGIPVLFQGRVVAVLVFHAKSLGEEDRGLVRLITTVAAELGGVMAAKRAEDRLRFSEARFAGILDVAADSIVSIDGAQRITLFNRAAERMFGYEAAEVLGQPLEILLPDDARPRHADHVRGFVGSGATARYMNQRNEIRGRRKDGSIFPAEATISRLQLGTDLVCTVVLRDISARKEAEAALRAQAIRDDLTGLHNRRGFLVLAEQKLVAAKRSSVSCLLLYLDMDEFKAINDGHGHAAGDAALIEVAGILRRTFRESDVVARVGGDEFVVLARCDGADAEAAIRERLRVHLEAANETACRPYSLSLCVGAAAWDPAAPISLEALMAAADVRMLEEKRLRKIGRESVG